MAKMGMDQDNEQYKRQQDATTRDLQLLMHYDEQDQANAREQRGYDFQMKRDEQNFDQQKELAKIKNQYDMNQIAATQRFTAGQNASQNQISQINNLVDNGVSYEDAKARVMGTSGQQTNVGDYIKSKE
jgi:hypothetical protein